MPGEGPPLEQVLLDDAAGVVAECADVDEAEEWASVRADPVPSGWSWWLPGDGRFQGAGRGGGLRGWGRGCDGGRVDQRLRPGPGPAPRREAGGAAGGERRAAAGLDRRAGRCDAVPGSAVDGLLGGRAVGVDRLRALRRRRAWSRRERQRFAGLIGVSLRVRPPIEAIEGPFLQQTYTVLRPLDLADARVMVEAALEQRDHTDLGYDGDDGQDHELRALVAQRVALLPDGGARSPGSLTEEEIHGLCEEFVDVSEEAMPDEAESVARRGVPVRLCVVRRRSAVLEPAQSGAFPVCVDPSQVGVPTTSGTTSSSGCSPCGFASPRSAAVSQRSCSI